MTGQRIEDTLTFARREHCTCAVQQRLQKSARASTVTVQSRHRLSQRLANTSFSVTTTIRSCSKVTTLSSTSPNPPLLSVVFLVLVVLPFPVFSLPLGTGRTMTTTILITSPPISQKSITKPPNDFS